MRRFNMIMCTGFILITLGSGCGTVRETLPERSAAEQLMLSSAADRALDGLPAEHFANQNVFIDMSNLETYDKPYVMQRIRQAVLDAGANIVAAYDDPDFILEVASGGLSIDKSEKLAGLPSIPLPIAIAGVTLETPEIPLWKTIKYQGRGKFLFTAVNPASGGKLFDIPHCYGKVRDTYWWLLVVGPFRFTDLPKEAR